MTVYNFYINQYDSSIATLQKLRKNSEIDDLLKKLREINGKTLEDYMISPIQR